jgi:hypothetical protein
MPMAFVRAMDDELLKSPKVTSDVIPALAKHEGM